jgi:tetratricopeptide (TPR) repeat protein
MDDQKNPHNDELSRETFKKIIIELTTHKESKAANELSKVYFKQDPTDIQNLGLLSKSHFDLKEFNQAYEYLLDAKNGIEFYNNSGTSVHIDSININIAKCLYYMKRSYEAIEILENVSEELKNKEDWKVDYSLYLNSVGRFEDAWNILKNIHIDITDSSPNFSLNNIKLDKNLTSDAVAFNCAWFLFTMGKFKEAFSNVVRGSTINVWGNENELSNLYNIGKEKRWIFGEKVKTIALYLEGGIGDELVFLRWYSHLKPHCSKIKIFCSRKIVNLLKECGYPDVYPHNQIVLEKWCKYAPSMSLPHILQVDSPRENINFSYLTRNPNPVKILDEVAKGRKKICIKWKGNTEFEHDQFRLFPVEKLIPLSQYGQLFSIQIEDKEDLHKNAPVWDLSDNIDSWSDTYDIISDCDLVVSSCTAVAHLAATMGKKVIVLVPLVPYFIWASDDVPWYNDNVTTIKQTEYNNWDAAFEKLYQVAKIILEE